LLRIALVYGDDAAVAHVREAMQGHVDIVYATSAADFDAARMKGTNAVAALVNLDDGDWLEDIETSLDAAGVAVVYNDPEISRGLEGWARARWLRHLLAKLRGSADVDPPRPQQAVPLAGDIPAAAEPTAPAPTEAPFESEAMVAERPLSPQEIETMTADFVATQPVLLKVGQAATQPRVVIVDEPTAEGAPEPATDVDGVDARVAVAAPLDDAAPVPMQVETTADTRAEADPSGPIDDADLGNEEDLDVDTEALSAMIDARLADPEPGTPSDSPEVWRLVESGSADPVPQDATAESGSDAGPVDGPAEAAEPVRAADVAPDDSDVLASLPPLDDWQLVDADAASAPVKAPTREHDDFERAFSESFAGLELVPMESVSALEINADPTARWLHGTKPATPQTAAADGIAKASSGGGKA
jgi:two-component system chemotaxis response regulator CheB/chemosensory pili system protein ChpB (putative protein-glutamate methylesterase)